MSSSRDDSFCEDDMYISQEDCSESINNPMASSWIEMIEEELSDSLTNKQFTGSLNKNIDEPENKSYLKESIERLENGNIEKLHDIEILQYQTNIANDLRKEMNEPQCTIEKTVLINVLDRLLNGSLWLSERLGLSMVHHKQITKDDIMIPRSSYKFCNYNYECEFNYNLRRHSGCYAQHFVHNMIYADIYVLRNYVKFNYDNNQEKYMNEIKKSVNTISFVINHMYDELKNAMSYYCIDKNEKMHIERTPKKNKKKRKNTLHAH